MPRMALFLAKKKDLALKFERSKEFRRRFHWSAASLGKFKAKLSFSLKSIPCRSDVTDRRNQRIDDYISFVIDLRERIL